MLIGFFVGQKIGAAVCQERYGMKGMEARAFQIESMHQERIGKAGEVRQAMLIRLHGEKWRKELYRINKEFTTHVIRTTQPNRADCHFLDGEFLKELEQGWDYIQLKLDAIFKRDKAMGRVCGED